MKLFFFGRLHYGGMPLLLFFLVLTALITVGGGFNDYDYYQLDYHRPRDRQVALNLQAKAVKNQVVPNHCWFQGHQ
eukprot:08135.XXX_487200_488120_1 [CDS] Oithona nana genome sequencing.